MPKNHVGKMVHARAKGMTSFAHVTQVSMVTPAGIVSKLFIYLFVVVISMVSCQNGPTRHAYAWQIGPFWQDTIDICAIVRHVPGVRTVL